MAVTDMNNATIVSNQVARMPTRRAQRRRGLIFASRRFLAALRLRRRSGHPFNRSVNVIDSLRAERFGPPFCNLSGLLGGSAGGLREPGGTSAVRRVQCG